MDGRTDEQHKNSISPKTQFAREVTYNEYCGINLTRFNSIYKLNKPWTVYEIMIMNQLFEKEEKKIIISRLSGFVAV